MDNAQKVVVLMGWGGSVCREHKTASLHGKSSPPCIWLRCKDKRFQ